MPWYAIVALLLVAACDRGVGQPNLILLSIDTLRADHLGAYGYDRPTSPNLDRLAEQGALFEDVSTSSPWTLPSHASMLTGRYPSNHGLSGLENTLDESAPTLAEILRRAGYHTAAFVNSMYFQDRYGLPRGFEHFVYEIEQRGRVEPSGILGKAQKWLSRAPAEPFFLFLHVYDVHSDYRARPPFNRPFRRPYRGPYDGSTDQLIEVQNDGRAIGPRDGRQLIDLYDGGIRQTDFVLSRFLEAARRAGALENTVLIITSDHGEEFLEHGSVLHGSSMHEELLRVPLIVKGPGVRAGTRIAEPVSIVDIAPTALSLLGVPPPDGFDGIDLSNGLRGGTVPGDRRLFAEADHRSEGAGQLQAVRAGRYKLHRDESDGSLRLFDLATDPGERTDIAREHPERVEALAADLRELTAGAVSSPRAQALSPVEIERLQSLGYLTR